MKYEIVHTTASALIARENERRNCFSLIHADPPWRYSNTGTQGAAKKQYETMGDGEIAADLNDAFDIAATPAYLVAWCTFPKLREWFAAVERGPFRWRYVSGGAWGKIGQFGVGFHFAGDAEVALLYTKGKAKPREGRRSNLWLAKRRDCHSEKPPNALETFVEMATKPGETIFEPYAGESASMAIIARRLGRGYLGAEADEMRHDNAIGKLAQQELF